MTKNRDGLLPYILTGVVMAFFWLVIFGLVGPILVHIWKWMDRVWP